MNRTILPQPVGRLAVTNGRLVLPAEIVVGGALLIEDGRIVAIIAVDDLGQETARFDAGGRYVTPGLIDLHIHGARGHTFNEAGDLAFEAITRETARRGITSLLATTSTDSIEHLTAALGCVRRWVKRRHTGSQILGAHVEGPYFNPAQAGAQDPDHLRVPADGSAAALLDYHDIIKIFSLAPELPGALELTAMLARHGIVPAAGHSGATDSQLRAAMAHGLRHIIHIWSGQSTTVRDGPWRVPGLLEATLAFDDLTVEMIADNKHLPPTLMRLAYKCIGPGRLCLISDATSGAGLPDGARFRMGGMEYEVCDGVGMLLDHTAFAGSTTLLSEMIAIVTRVVDVPLVEAVRMASLTPARAIGVAERKGSLEPGKDADLVIFEDDFTAQRVMIGGCWVD